MVKSSNEEDKTPLITIDDKQYDLSKMSVAAKEALASIQFVEGRVHQLNNEWAVADTARMAYISALKREMAQ